MRRDRLLVTLALATVFSADVYFVLLPKLREKYPGDECTCPSTGIANISQGGGTEVPQWTLNSSTVTRDSLGVFGIGKPVETGGKIWASKLEKLFAHPLYNIRSPDPGPDEVLLQSEELMGYYKRKVSRWERWVRCTLLLMLYLCEQVCLMLQVYCRNM